MTACPIPETREALVVRLHAELICEAGELEESSRRHRLTDPERAMQAADDAAMAREKAAAIADVLRRASPHIAQPNPGALSLLSDGVQP